MRQFELVERVLAYNPDTDEQLLNKAYVYAMQKHGSQMRASGDPYFAHPLEVAAILTDLKLDDASIVVGLLHDTIEDTDATRAEIDQMFGPEIGAIVDGLTKIERLNLVSREQAQAENLRKLLLAISADVRVLLVKLADRLHNMRTLEFMPPDKRKRIAEETMDIYAPLAGRMGMQDMRSELENLSFRWLLPDHYKAITERLSEMQADHAETIKAISAELSEKLKSEGIDGAVSARLKSPWSIYKKIERKQVSLEQLSDMIGFRIIVKTVEDCYRVVGVVHTSWKVVPGRFKDYISVPKHNDYRSIHTTIFGPGRQRVELQIRTEEMHRVAELGIAAHALYKDGSAMTLERLEKESKAYQSLRSTIGHLTAGTPSTEFLEFTKLELFQDQVFCFTPKGRLIALPRGATPIDFAYALHTDIGDTCVGAKINGSIMPLVTQLKSGDEVEIIRDQNHLPPSNWESIAQTGKARAAIRRAVRQATQQRAFALGEHVLAMLLEREGTSLDETETKSLAEALGQAGRRELLIAIGEDPDREGLQDTPARVARAYAELTAGLRMAPEDVLTTVFDLGHDEMVLVRDIELWSMCEHHLVPFTGVAHVGYIPSATGKITGLSKLARLVDVYAKRPQVQERLTTQVADALMRLLEARGVIVVIEAEHLCMTMRGVKKAGARTITSAVRGTMRSNAATRAEAMALIHRG